MSSARTVPERRATAWIGLGSNLGDRRAHLDGAVRALGALEASRLVAVSAWIETEPVGGPPGQGRYLNGAAALETALGPRALLAELQRIEREHGRTRAAEVRHGPRTLDLDLLLHGAAVVREPDLVVPHPRLAEREFVLRPLAEIAADVLVPGTGRTVAELLAERRWLSAAAETSAQAAGGAAAGESAAGGGAAGGAAAGGAAAGGAAARGTPAPERERGERA